LKFNQSLSVADQKPRSRMDLSRTRSLWLIEMQKRRKSSTIATIGILYREFEIDRRGGLSQRPKSRLIGKHPCWQDNFILESGDSPRIDGIGKPIC